MKLILSIGYLVLSTCHGFVNRCRNAQADTRVAWLAWYRPTYCACSRRVRPDSSSIPMANQKRTVNYTSKIVGHTCWAFTQAVETSSAHGSPKSVGWTWISIVWNATLRTLALCRKAHSVRIMWRSWKQRLVGQRTSMARQMS